MKKLYVLLIVAILATTLVAANPPGKLVRLEINNKSGNVVYMKLEGKYTHAFYYLTVQKDDDKTFTVITDQYARTTWACGGVKNTGKLIMSSQVRLTFTSCTGGVPTRVVGFDADGHPIRVPDFGVPTNEKVFYMVAFTNYFWEKVPGVGWVLVKNAPFKQRTYKVPQGQYFRYRY